MIEDIDLEKLNDAFEKTLDPNLFVEENDTDDDTARSHHHHHVLF